MHQDLGGHVALNTHTRSHEGFEDAGASSFGGTLCGVLLQVSPRGEIMRRGHPCKNVPFSCFPPLASVKWFPGTAVERG